MTDPAETGRIQARRARAEQELMARGVMKRGYPPGLRLTMALFPRLKAPFYGDHALHGLVLGAWFALGVGLVLMLVLALAGADSFRVVPLAAVPMGIGFGAIFALFMARVHRRVGLTAWEDLDKPPGPVPEGAEDYAVVEGELIRQMGQISNLARRF